MAGRNPHSMYFIAILCPAEIEKKVRQYKNWMLEHFGCRVALRSPAHITLVPPFWSDDQKEERLLEIFTSFQTDTSGLNISLSDFSHFSNRVLFIRVKDDPDLENLKQKTHQYFINELGDVIKPDHRPFSPHVTIANRDLKPGDFVKAWERFSKTVFDEAFVANKIALLKLGEAGWKVISEKDWQQS